MAKQSWLRREAIWMIKTNLWLKLTGSAKALFHLQLTIALYYSGIIIRTSCTGRLFSPSKKETKKINHSKSLIHVWFRQQSNMGKCHTKWVVMPSTSEWSMARENSLLILAIPASKYVLLVSEPFKGWTGYWQCNYIYRKKVGGFNLATWYKTTEEFDIQYR